MILEIIRFLGILLVAYGVMQNIVNLMFDCIQSGQNVEDHKILNDILFIVGLVLIGLVHIVKFHDFL